jgi:hypothetical protein
VTLGVYGQGETSSENLNALLDDLIQGLGEITPVFLVPLGKDYLTPAVQAVIDYALEKGYTYKAIHSEPVGRLKALKTASDAAAELVKVESVPQELLDRLVKAREARLLFFWLDDPDANEDEQRLLNAVLAEGVTCLDVAGGMEPIAPDDPEEGDDSAEDTAPEAGEADSDAPDATETPESGELEPEDPSDPNYAVASTWPARRLKEFMVSIGYTDDDHPETGIAAQIEANLGTTVVNANNMLKLLYEDEHTAEPTMPGPATPEGEDRADTPAGARAIREEIEAEGKEPNAARIAELKAEAAALKTATPAADEAQAMSPVSDLQGVDVGAVGHVIATAIAESLADLIVDKVIERLRARALEAPKDDIVRDLVPPRRPGRPRNEE